MLHKIIVYAMEYEEAERRTNSVETPRLDPDFFFSFSLFLSLYARARKSRISNARVCLFRSVGCSAKNPSAIRHFSISFLNTKYDKAADIRLASTL